MTVRWALKAGQVVAGRFRLERPLGEGGMAAVWAARHVVTKRRFAIKVLKPPATSELVQRFMREARAASTALHPNILQVHDVFDLENGLPAMVMDALEGESLGRKLERDGALSLNELAGIMAPLLRAVAAIHAAGIVHRDLKPDNVFLARTADGRIEPMLLDFGICKLDLSADSFAHNHPSTTAGRILGTPSYMAPEQTRGVAGVDAQSDVWALGVMLYECVTGKLPWPSHSMSAIIAAITAGPTIRVEKAAPQLPPELATLINRMLRRHKSERVSDLASAANVLERAAGVAGPLSLAPVAFLRSLPPAQLQRLRPVAFGAFALVAATLGFLALRPSAAASVPIAPMPVAAAQPAAVTLAPEPPSEVYKTHQSTLTDIAAAPSARPSAPRTRALPNYGGRR